MHPHGHRRPAPAHTHTHHTLHKNHHYWEWMVPTITALYFSVFLLRSPVRPTRAHKVFILIFCYFVKFCIVRPPLPHNVRCFSFAIFCRSRQHLHTIFGIGVKLMFRKSRKGAERRASEHVREICAVNKWTCIICLEGRIRSVKQRIAGL